MSKTTDNRIRTIVILGLLTGTLDAIAAVIISRPSTPTQIARYIASGAFGPRAFTADNMVFWGIFFHYAIALLFSLALFELHPQFKKKVKNKYVLGLVYGLFVWVVMTFAILPLTGVPKQPEPAPIMWATIFKNIAALIICLGFPIALISDRYYIRKARRRSRRHKATTSF